MKWTLFIILFIGCMANGVFGTVARIIMALIVIGAFMVFTNGESRWRFLVQR